MKKFGILFFLVLGSVALRAQEIEVSTQEIDFGVLRHGVDTQQTVRIWNRGAEWLVIQHVQRSCGCTGIDWPRRPLLEGDSLDLTVGYDTKRYGPFDKKLTILTNAKHTPAVEVRVRGRVLTPSEWAAYEAKAK